MTTTTTKTIYIGTVPTFNGTRDTQSGIFCKAEIEEGSLSITGVIGPLPSGNARGGCGQMQDAIREAMDAGTIEYAPGWDKEKTRTLLDTWDTWHLNDMKAACEHQRANGWEELAGEKVNIDGNEKTLGWLDQSQHPRGILSKACEVCGYEYGSAWHKVELPAEVVEFINALPGPSKTPAWV